MPITKSAKKALRQSKRRRVENLAKKNKLRKERKELRIALSAKDEKRAKEKLSSLYKTLDKMAKVNIFHPNKASRLKKGFAKKLNEVFKSA